MTYEEAVATAQELRTRYDKPFSALDKATIEHLYTEVLGKTENFTCGSHFRSEYRVNLREHVEWECSFLNTVVRNNFILECRYR